MISKANKKKSICTSQIKTRNHQIQIGDLDLN